MRAKMTRLSDHAVMWSAADPGPPLTPPSAPLYLETYRTRRSRQPWRARPLADLVLGVMALSLLLGGAGVLWVVF